MDDVCRRGHVNPPRNKWGGCEPCLSITRRRWAQNNPEKKKAAQKKWDRRNADAIRATRRRYVYGITPAQVDAQLRQQAGCCAICNTALGLLRDDPSVIDAAAAYLRRHA